MNRRYSWKPDLPDQRDRLLALRAAPLPAFVDLRASGFFSAVEDQGQLGSCTGNAWAGALEYIENKNASTLLHIPAKRTVRGPLSVTARPGTPFFDVSRLFIYYNERAIEGTVKQDAGAEIRDGAKALAKLGYCTEALWPYVISQFAKKPPVVAFKDALRRRISEYLRCDDLAAIKQSLADGYPVVIGFTVYEGFESATVARTGALNMPKKGERVLGGHAVLVVGYDDSTRRVIVRNSWGAAWGKKGYFTMPYAYLESRNLSDDFWTVRK